MRSLDLGTAVAMAVLLAGTAGVAWTVAEPAGDSQDAGARPTWFSRHLDPRDDALFLDLDVEDARRDDLWLLAQRYHGARGEGEPFYELWGFESGARQTVLTVPGAKVDPDSFAETVRRLDDGTVALGFLGPDGAPVVLVFDPRSREWRDWGGSAALRERGPAAAIAIDRQGDVIVASAGQALSTVARVADDGGVRWAHAFTGTGGDLAQVTEISAMGESVVALGFREQIDAALVVLDAQGRPSAVTPLPEAPARLIPSHGDEVAVAMGLFEPEATVPIAAFELETAVPESADEAAAKTGTVALARESTALALPTATRRNKRLTVAHACGDLYAYADEEKAPSGKSIRFALVGPQGELVERILTGADPEDPIIVSSISLVPRGAVLYVAATVVKVLETREIRSGIDLYRLDLSGVCGPASEQESMR